MTKISPSIGPFMHVPEAVNHVNALKLKPAIAWCRQLDSEALVELLEAPELRRGPAIVAALITAGRTDFLAELAQDRLADLLAGLTQDELDAALRLLAPPRRTSVMRLMSYPQGTAGSLMTTEFVQVPQAWDVARTLAHIRATQHQRETVYAIYVVDEADSLRFVLSLRQLVCADPAQPLAELADGSLPVTTHAFADREEVARIIRRYDFLALPVVDEDRRVLGIVTVDDVIDALMDEAQEDMNRFGGGEHMGAPYLEVGFTDMVRKRGAWLALLFLGEMLTASAMQYYEIQLEKAVVLAMFIPLIMSSGGNSGSQATSLLIRGLALGEVRLRDWWRVLVRELPTSVVLGAGLGAIGFARIVVWQHAGFYDYGPHYLLIAFTIWASLVGIVCFGSSIGSMLPFVLQCVGLDPASASAPLVATLVDVLGLVIYFSVAALFLAGTLL